MLAFRSKQQAVRAKIAAADASIHRLEAEVAAETDLPFPDARKIVDLLGQLMGLEAERCRLTQKLLSAAGPFAKPGFLDRVSAAQQREAAARRRLGDQRVIWLTQAEPVRIPQAA
jgi:hypothetical protein